MTDHLPPKIKESCVCMSESVSERVNRLFLYFNLKSYLFFNIYINVLLFLLLYLQIKSKECRKELVGL